MASALEETLLVKMFLGMIMEPKLTIDEAQKSLTMDTAVVTDCKALFDLLKRDGIQASLDKRVAIKVQWDDKAGSAPTHGGMSSSPATSS